MIRIGAQFAEERKRQNLSIEEVAKATKIREEFLSAIERGDYNRLPSPAYAHGFVRNYAKFLGLPVEKSLALFRREFDSKKSIEVLPQGLTKSSDFSMKFRLGRSAVLVSVLFLIIAGFLLYQYRSAYLDPGIKIESPEENQTINSLNLTVRGKTDPNSTLVVENEPVTLDQNGGFEKEITVFPGTSEITFLVENRFGRSTQVIRKIKVTPK